MVCQEWAVNELGENVRKKLQSILERLSWDNFSFYQRRLVLMGFCLFINYLSGENTFSILLHAALFLILLFGSRGSFKQLVYM